MTATVGSGTGEAVPPELLPILDSLPSRPRIPGKGAEPVQEGPSGQFMGVGPHPTAAHVTPPRGSEEDPLRIDPTLAPWPQYSEAVVELMIDGLHVVLTPLVEDVSRTQVEDAAQQLVALVGAPPPPVWVLTAGDPYPEELSAEENAARNAALHAELSRSGLRHDPALGRAPDGATFEVSTAVRGSSRVDVLALAARHGQLAVYELADQIRCIDVATGAVVTSRPFRVAHATPGDDSLVGPTGWRG